MNATDANISGSSPRFWLVNCKTDAMEMFHLRTALASDFVSAYQPALSDDEVIDRVSHLMESGRLHVHTAPSFIDTGGGGGAKWHAPPLPKPAPLKAEPIPKAPPVAKALCCATLAIQELTFVGNNVVENDTTGDFSSPEWVRGRAQVDQSPIAYARRKKVSVNAKFKVTATACQPGEAVAIKGKAVFGSATLEWDASVTISPGDADVSVSLTSNSPLGNAVGIFESSDINWQFNPCKQGWSSAGTTRNIFYVTLGDPSGSVNYWTLLDVSCRAAAGESTEAGVIAKAFDSLRGRAISRKRDGHDLTYWNPQGVCKATDTTKLLAAGNGAGQCGSWAEFLIDMYRIHGITSAEKILIVRSQTAWTNNSEGFLVKHWIFDHPPASAASSYTHWVPSQCRPGTNLPGQRNTAPPPAFYNHFIVRADGKFWDPSYGAGPFADQMTWENNAIDGLFRDPPVGAPKGTTTQTGFEKSLDAKTTIVEFWSLTTNTKI